jgi:hypothetical protein
MHPFVPFITEELWRVTGEQGPKRERMLIQESWPDYSAIARDAAAEAEMNWVKTLISEVRSVRAEMNVPPSAKLPLVLKSPSAVEREWLTRHNDMILRMARLEAAVAGDAFPKGAAQIVAGEGTAALSLEGFIDFDYEITLLTVRHVGGTSFCAPIGHRQENGDYQESWQPQPMSPKALAESERVALAVTEALGGRGLVGGELFVKGDQVWFSDVSPRPHDTGLVTLISQELSEFALHARAILGLPIPVIRQMGPSASAVILVEGDSQQASFANLGAALSEQDTALRLFGKPEARAYRRMGVVVCQGADAFEARDKAIAAAAAIVVTVEPR